MRDSDPRPTITRHAGPNHETGFETVDSGDDLIATPDGRIDIDSDVRQYVSGVRVDGVTITHCLHHTAESTTHTFRRGRDSSKA